MLAAVPQVEAALKRLAVPLVAIVNNAGPSPSSSRNLPVFSLTPTPSLSVRVQGLTRVCRLRWRRWRTCER